MRTTIYGKVLLAGALTIFGYGTAAQAPKSHSALGIAVSYDGFNANLVSGSRFWMQGGGAEANYGFNRHLSAVASFSAAHTSSMASTGLGLDFYSLDFGPRFSVAVVPRRLTMFGQALGGASFGRSSLFPSSSSATTSDTGYALEFGGGATLPVSKRLSFRLIEANWLRTGVNNSTNATQNTLRLGTGIAFQF